MRGLSLFSLQILSERGIVMIQGQKVLIVGGVAGGASTAPRLRRLDEQAEIIMFERGEYVSFANCGLPYFIGGEIKDKTGLTVQTPQDFVEKFKIDVRTKQKVTAIDTEKKKVTVKKLDSGEIYEESYDKLVLSMGAEPILANIEGSNSNKVFMLRNIPDTYRIKDYLETKTPRSAVVMGGGFIGVEMAENLRRAGLVVTLVEMADQVIAPIDPDMAADVHRYIESKGVRLALKNGVQAIHDDGRVLHIELNQGSVDADMLVMAIGVRPEASIAAAAGIQLNERGAIIVDEHMRTSAPDVYAVGDVVEITDSVTGQKGYVPLAGPANKQGRIAADNICGIDSTYPGTQGSSILKVFDMTVASTGVNEKTAKRLGLNYDKAFTYSGNHAGYYPGAVNMAIKTIFETETGKILGAQIVGYDGVDKRCDVLATAIRAGMTASDLAKLELCYAPPYGSAKDPVNMVGFVIENLVTGKVKQIHWHDLSELPQDGSVTRVDIRTPIEFENGHIDSFSNIPLTQLRNRLQELDKSKPVYVNCQIGLKAYAGARILSQNGFDVSIIAGGYRLYQSIFGNRPQLQAMPIAEKQSTDVGPKSKVVLVDACGMQCPGPIVKLSAALNDVEVGDVIEITTSDPAFASDIDGFCRRTGNQFVSIENSKGISTAKIQKGLKLEESQAAGSKDGKNIIVFSGDLDKAIASFIIANAAAAMGRKVSMFFTFWGLNILRKPEKISVKKDFMSKMFGMMMPRGSKKLGLSKMNMGGMGAKMIRGVMQNKNIDSLEDLIKLAQSNGVELVACSMSMDVMGITKEELVDGVKLAGAAAMLANAEESDMSLFI
jgi:NADPH-dependent 2,4-dienoyl-CoA reductase/sulfur reductase-like enzyme/peroxiredoxin family protein/TusA-related sulfurtransferase/rhodanese-related sulfurtransferase